MSRSFRCSTRASLSDERNSDREIWALTTIVMAAPESRSDGSIRRQEGLSAGSEVPSRIPAEKDVQRPAPPTVRPRPPVMGQDFHVGTTSPFQFAGQFGHPA